MEKLEESQLLQQEIAEGQRDSLEYQRQLVENGSYLSQAIEASRGNVQEMMAEFKMSTMEQRNMIFEVFDRVSRLQNLVVSEVSWLYTVVFYCFSLLVIYLVTATKRTADARLWLFLLLTVNFGLERAVIKSHLGVGRLPQPGHGGGAGGDGERPGLDGEEHHGLPQLPHPGRDGRQVQGLQPDQQSAAGGDQETEPGPEEIHGELPNTNTTWADVDSSWTATTVRASPSSILVRTSGPC